MGKEMTWERNSVDGGNLVERGKRSVSEMKKEKKKKKEKRKEEKSR